MWGIIKTATRSSGVGKTHQTSLHLTSYFRWSEDHERSGWTTSRHGQDSTWNIRSEWQRTEINGESMSMVWPTLGSRTNRTEQNRTSADNVALPAFAAARRAAARLMLTVGPPAVQQSIDISWPPAHSSKPAAAACGGQVGQTDRRCPTAA